MMKRAILMGLALGVVSAANAQVLFTGSYSQDFNTLASTSAANVWTNNVTPLVGWYATRTVYVANNGGNNAGALYSYGLDAPDPNSSDRALGSIGSQSTATVFYGVRLVNNSGGSITSLRIRYRGEQWRYSGNATAQTVNFGFKLGAAAINEAGYSNVAALAFTSPSISGSTGTRNGNLAENSQAFDQTFSVGSWAAGQELWLRWEDIDHAGADHGLAVDDLFVTNATPVPEPITMALGIAGAGVFVRRRLRKA